MSIVRSDAASGAYGRSLAMNFGADEAPAIVSRLLQHAEFAVTEVVADHPNGQLTTPIPLDDAYLICLNLRAVRYKTYWEEGREIGVCVHRTGETAISDLRRDPRVIMDSPVHHLMMYLPRATINALAEQASLPRVENIRFEPGPSVRDEIFWELGQSLLPALRAPEQANRLFTDHVAMALALHAAYVVWRPEPHPADPWRASLVAGKTREGNDSRRLVWKHIHGRDSGRMRTLGQLLCPIVSQNDGLHTPHLAAEGPCRAGDGAAPATGRDGERRRGRLRLRQPESLRASVHASDWHKSNCMAATLRSLSVAGPPPPLSRRPIDGGERFRPPVCAILPK
jgi:hypothetical protein